MPRSARDDDIWHMSGPGVAVCQHAEAAVEDITFE